MVKLFCYLWPTDLTNPHSHYQGSRYISKVNSNYQETCGWILLKYLFELCPNVPPQRNIQPSINDERKRRRGAGARPGFHFLKFYTTHHPVHLAGAPHHERPIDPWVEADVVEGLRRPLEGCDRDAILWQLWYWWCWQGSVAQVKYERSQEPQGRHIQQVPPPTNIWRRRLLKYFFQPKKKTADRPLDQGFNVRRNKRPICGGAPL